MREWKRFVGALLVGLILPSLGTAQTQTGSEIVGTSVSLDEQNARLELELTDGRTVAVALRGGQVFVDGEARASYARDGALLQEWRELLEAAIEGPERLRSAWEDFFGGNETAAQGPGALAVRAALAPLLGGEVPELPAATPQTTTAETAAATPELAPVQEAVSGEIIQGGLVVELRDIEGAASTLSRLAPGLPSDLTRALQGPLRIVIDADEYRLPRGSRIDRALLIVDSDAVIAGEVAGDVIVADGSLRIEPGGRIEGNVLSIDGRIENTGGTIVGELRELDEQIRQSTRLRVADVRTQARSRSRSMFHHIARGFGSLIQTVAGFLIWAFLGVLVVYFFRGHLENVSDTVSYSFGRSFLAGLAAEILFFPVLLVLCVLVLTWLIIPFYLLGFGVAGLLGYLAVGHAIGENMTRRRFPSWPARLRRSNSYYYVVNGLALLIALFAVAAVVQMGGPLLGWANGLLLAAAFILTWVAATSGLGAVILSRAGTRRDFARPREVPDLSTDPLQESMDDMFRGGAGEEGDGDGEPEEGEGDRPDE